MVVAKMHGVISLTAARHAKGLVGRMCLREELRVNFVEFYFRKTIKLLMVTGVNNGSSSIIIHPDPLQSFKSYPPEINNQLRFILQLGIFSAGETIYFH